MRAGKVRAIGSSTFPPSQIVEAQWTAERRGRERFMCEQPPYSILARGIERSVLPVCERYGMGVLTWSPLAAGFLSGKYRKDRPVDLTSGRAARQPFRFDPSLPGNAAKFEAVEKLVELAAEVGCSLPELAVAFAATHPGVTSVILGPRTMEQLESLLKGAPLTLDDATLDRIDEIVPPGTDVFKADAVWNPSSLTDPARRRRPQATRAAG